MAEIREIEHPELLVASETAVAARAEGFGFVDRLSTEYRDGVNRFDKPGELLLGAFSDRLLGICGLNVDPYENDPSAGRIRHLYVLPAVRRHGIGRSLVQTAIERALMAFVILRLRTDTAEAAAFYEALGFLPVRHAKATHQLHLRGGSSLEPGSAKG